MAGIYSKGEKMRRDALLTLTIIAAIAALLIIGGCTQKPQQQPLLPQQPQAVATPAPQPQITPEAEAEAAQEQPEDDLYNDNLGGSLDDLSQLEQ